MSGNKQDMGASQANGLAGAEAPEPFGLGPTDGIPSAALCECGFEDDDDDRPLCLKQMPGGDYQIRCDECGAPVIDDEPKSWRDLADAAIMDLRHYADDELPHRRLVSARAYERRFALLASADTHPKGQDRETRLGS